MLTAGAVLLIIGAIITTVLSMIGMSFTGVAFSLTVLILASCALKHRDNVSLGTTLMLIQVLWFFNGGLIIKGATVLNLIFAIFLTAGLSKYKKQNAAYLLITDEDAEEAEKIRKAREEIENAGKASARNASAETETADVTVADALMKEAEEEAAEETEEEVPGIEDEDQPVPGLTGMISSEDVKDGAEILTEEEYGRKLHAYEDAPEEEDPELPEPEPFITLNTTKEWYEAPERKAPASDAPEVIVLQKNGSGEKEAKKLVLESVFRREENRFMPDEPFFIESEEGFGWNDTVKVIRYTIRNRTGKAWKYLSYSVTCTDILGNAIETEKSVDVKAEREIMPGETFIIDVPSREYGSVRGVKTALIAAVDGNGEVFRYRHDDEKLVALPERRETAPELGEYAEEFLESYAEDNKTGFRPDYAYTLNEKGSACTCPCCGEAMLYDDTNCPCCGAPRERFVFAALPFLKRKYGTWSAEKKARLELQAKMKAEKERRERIMKEREEAEAKAEENRKNNMKMWTVTLILALFIFLAWLYYHAA